MAAAAPHKPTPCARRAASKLSTTSASDAGYQDCRADALQHPECNQLADGVGGRAQPGRDGEQHHAVYEHPFAPEKVGDPAAGHQEGSEGDVVGVEHPRQAADVAVVEIPLDGRESDVDDRGVEESKEGAEGRHQQHRRRGGLAASRERRRGPA